MSSIGKTPEEAHSSGSFTSRAAWITGANFLSFALATLTPFIITNLLPPLQVGLYKQAFLIVTVTTAMLNMQVGSGGYYFIPRLPEKRFQIAFNILLFYFLIGTLVAISFVLYPQWSAAVFESKDIIQHIPVVGVVILLWLMSATLEMFPLALGDARAAATFIVMSQISRSGLMIGATVLFRSETAIIWSAVIQCSFQLALTFLYLWRHYGPWRNPLDWPLFIAQMTNAIPYGIGGMIYTMQGEMHNVFISHFFSPAVFAVYSVGCFQLPFLSVLTSSFTSVMIPEIAHLEAGKDYRGIIALWTGSMRKLALAFIPGCILLFVVRKDFFAFLFPKAYEGAASIFAIYLLCILMTMPLPGPILRAFEEFKYFRLKLYLVLLPVSFAALYTGVKLGGLIGVILAVVCVQALDLTVTLRVISRRLGFTRHDLRELTPMLWTALAGVMAGVAVSLARGFLHHTVPQNFVPIPRMYPALILIISGLVFAVAYLVGVLAFGAITETEIKDFYPALVKIRRFVPGLLWRKAAMLRIHREERLPQENKARALDYVGD